MSNQQQQQNPTVDQLCRRFAAVSAEQTGILEVLSATVDKQGIEIVQLRAQVQALSSTMKKEEAPKVTTK